MTDDEIITVTRLNEEMNKMLRNEPNTYNELLSMIPKSSFTISADQYQQMIQQDYDNAIRSIDEMLFTERNEQKAADIINFRMGEQFHQQQNALMLFVDCFTDAQILYDLIIDVYINDGYNFPRKLIIKAKFLSKTVQKRMEGLPDEDVITVYRASNGAKPKLEPSWTTNKDVAIWFGNRQHPRKIYRAKINRRNVIAYSNDRGEFEVIQHNNIYDIKQIIPSNDEILKAMEEHKKDC